jgi:hypothetical protein
MTKKYISPEHAIRDIMGSKIVNEDETITEQALVAPKPVSPPLTMPKYKPLNPNVGGLPPASANDNKLPTIPKRDFLKDVGNLLNNIKKFTPLGAVLKVMTPTAAGVGSDIVVPDSPEFQKEYQRRVNAGELPADVAKDMKTWKPTEKPEVKPAEITPDSSPATEIPAPAATPVTPPYTPAAAPTSPTIVAPSLVQSPGIKPGAEPSTRTKPNTQKKDNKPRTRMPGFNLGSGVATPGQSGSISGFESPDYLHTAKSRLSDKPAKIVKENTADAERRSIENVPRPKSDRNKTMTRNQEIKKKILDENEMKKLIIKNAVKKSKDKNYSVELNPEYKHEKLSDQ